MTMPNRLCAHGLWKQRHESFDEVVENTHQMLLQLSNVDLEWKTWFRFYETEDEEKTGIRKILSGNPEEIKNEFLSNQWITEDGSVDKNRGYRLHAYSGTNAPPLSNASDIDITCGVQGPYQPFNNIAFEFPQFTQFKHCYDNIDKIALAVECLVERWNPDWLSVRILIEPAHNQLWHGSPILGWINYLSPQLGTLTTLPEGWQWWTNNKSSNKIFVFNSGLPSKDKPEDVAKIESLFKCVSWNKDVKPKIIETSS
jgi:hypothetical protein